MTLIMHAEILIEAAAADIWPYILQPNAWKKGAALQQVAGPSDGVGARYQAVEPGSATVLYHVMNVELVPPVRRTIKLLHDREGPLLGFASWALRERDGATTLTYDVYVEVSPAAGGPSTPESEASRGDEGAVQSGRLQEELQLLKEMMAARLAAKADVVTAPGRRS